MARADCNDQSDGQVVAEGIRRDLRTERSLSSPTTTIPGEREGRRGFTHWQPRP